MCHFIMNPLRVDVHKNLFFVKFTPLPQPNIMERHFQESSGNYIVFQNYGGHVILIVNLSFKGQN